MKSKISLLFQVHQSINLKDLLLVIKQTLNLSQDSSARSRPSLVKYELYIHNYYQVQNQHKLTFTGFQYARKTKIMKQRRRKTSISRPGQYLHQQNCSLLRDITRKEFWFSKGKMPGPE